MKKIINTVIFASVLFLASCDDNRLWGLEPDKVYLTRNGVVEEAAYDLGAVETMDLWAFKSGYRGESTTVKFSINPELILRHNEKYDTDYKLLPEEYYDMTAPSEINIAGKDMYAKFNFKYDTGKILELYGGEYERTDYVLPIQIRSSHVMISDEIETGDYALAAICVKKPVIEIMRDNFSELSYTVGEEGILPYSFNVGMPFENRWDVSYELTEDPVVLQALLDEFNAGSSVTYNFAPEDSYTMLTTEFTVKKGSESMEVNFEIDKSKIPFGNYAIIYAIESVDSPLFVGERYYIVLPVTVASERLDRTQWTVSSSSASTAAGEGIASIMDDNLNTFWHIAYGGIDTNPRIRFDMGESKMMYQVEIWPRRFDQGGNGTSLTGCAVYTSQTPLTIDDDWGSPIADVNLTVQATTTVFMINVIPTQGRYLMLKLRRNTNQVGINEIYVRGE